MNKDYFEGKWHQLKGTLRQQYGKLTDDDVQVINGKFENLVGKIQEKYGVGRDEAEKMVEKWQG